MEKNVRLYVIGLLSLIGVLVSVVLIGFRFGETANDEINNAVDQQYRKLHLVQELASIARNRQSLLVQITNTVDPFARDDLIQQFNQTANQFVAVRQRLLDEHIDGYELDLLEKQRGLSKIVVPIQQKIIELLIDGKVTTAKDLFVNSLSDKQNDVMLVLDHLVKHLQQESKQNIESSFARYRYYQNYAFWITVFVSITAVIFATAIVRKLSVLLVRQTQVSSELRDTYRALKKMNMELEHRVDERTESLMLANEQLKQEIVARTEMQNQYLLHVQQTPLAFLEVGTSGEILEWNPSASTFFEYTREETIGKNAIELIVSKKDKEKTSNIWFSSLKGENSIASIENVSKSGATKTFEWITAPLKNSDGQVTRVFCLGQDISERVKMLQAQDEFIAVVSHELRTPLTAIRASLGLLGHEIEGKVSDSILHLVKVAISGCERLSTIINDILDYEKLALDKMIFDVKTVGIDELIQQSLKEIQPYAVQYSVHAIYSGDPLGAYVEVDQYRLMQVLINLLSNAIKFSPKDSTVTVKAERDGSRVRVSVIDNGPGIPVEYQELMFTKFSQADSSNTRKKGGTGLGLAICQSIIQKLHGNIAFKTVIGKGTTFYFDLPIAKSKPQMAASAA